MNRPAYVGATSAPTIHCIMINAKIATSGLKSIMPFWGMNRRMGSMIGSVARCSIWTNGLDWSTGNQLMSERAMMAQVRMLKNVAVSCAM
ncbi:MAG: hypothetical protein WBO97_15950 [Tepidiformaceae bacterium]